MRTLLLLLLFIPVLSWAKLVTTTYATLTNVIITYKPETGASEHTLVVPPDYPSYTLAYTCTYDEGSYTLDIEVPDDPPPEEEEVEQEDGEGDGDGEEDGGVTFETSVVWSVERSGAIIDGSTTTRDVTVKFLEGNTEDVVLKVEVTVECTAGNGVGTHDSSTFKIHSPVWDTYHSISMYAENATIDAPRCAAVGEDVTFTVQLPNDSEYDRRLGVDIKTYLDDLKGPNSPRWNRPDALLGEVIVGDSVTWTASDTPTTEPAEISVVIDDSPYPKPPNERGTTDDDPYPLDAIQITIVAVDSLLPDIGEEIDDDDDDPDTRTFVLAVADTGVVTVEATPSAVIDDEKDLPEDWSLTGGTGTGKLLRTINRAAPGIYTITCICGTSHKTTKVIVLSVTSLEPDIGEEIDDGDDNPDTRTFVVCVADTGVVTVHATPNPNVAEAGLPADWSLTGGTGTGKLSRTVDRTTAGSHTLVSICGTSQKMTKVIVLSVASLEPDIGEEIDDGDDDPDTRTFVVCVADTGVVTVHATPNPSIAEDDLPDEWLLTGGDGTGKLQRTIDRTVPGIYTLTCVCGTSTKAIKVIVFEVAVFAETPTGEMNDGSKASLIECMENRQITYTAKVLNDMPVGIEKTFTFHFRKADGTNWSADVTTTAQIASYIALADKVENSSTQSSHKFTTPIYATVNVNGAVAISDTINIEVYELWIDYFRDSATGKSWKVCVGENISYNAIASIDCKDWFWDMEDGIPDAWNPTGGDAQSGSGMKITYADLARASNSWFGDKYGIVNVVCKDSEGNSYRIYSNNMRGDSTKAKVYFPPDVNINGTTPSTASPPCWFVFWRQKADNGLRPVPGLEDFAYNHTLSAYGQSQYIVENLWGIDYLWPDTILLEVGPLASGEHYSQGLYINGIEFGGATGINCTREVVEHEKKHNVYSSAIQNGALDNDPPQYNISHLGDLLPDSEEVNFGCSLLDKDTYNLRQIKHPGYAAYGDGEYAVMKYSKGLTGNAASDWSKGGKQW